MIKMTNTYYQSQPVTEFLFQKNKNKAGITTTLSERLYTHVRREYQVSPGDFEFLFVHDVPVSVVGVNMSKTGNYTV